MREGERWFRWKAQRVGGSTKCFSIENEGGFVSEARSRHLTNKESNDVASEPRYPQIRSEDSELLTPWKRGVHPSVLGAWCSIHGLMVFVNGCRLMCMGCP